jgi:hypothetical protein
MASLYQPCRKRIRSTKGTIEIGKVTATNEMLLNWPVISMYVHFTFHTSDVLINK